MVGIRFCRAWPLSRENGRSWAIILQEGLNREREPLKESRYLRLLSADITDIFNWGGSGTGFPLLAIPLCVESEYPMQASLTGRMQSGDQNREYCYKYELSHSLRMMSDGVMGR